jgi:PAS domain S-box-containing protein
MKPKVLVVEDDQPVLHVTVEVVKRAACDVVAATSAREAIRRLEEDKFNLVVTDFCLGKESGEDVVLAVRQLQPEVPVIIVTGSVEKMPGWLREPGEVARIFEKPYPSAELLMVIRQMLPSSDAQGVRELIDVTALPIASFALPKGVEEMVHRVVDQESIVAITDKKGMIVYANDRFCEISGYSRSELLGQNHRLLKSGQHPPAFYKNLWGTILEGRVWRGEICNRAKTGRLYYVDTVISPLRTEGLITHFVALRKDITAKKEMEKMLAERNKIEEENRRMEALGRMANGFLHDLNNILTGVMGIATESESAERDALLHDAIGRMAQLTRTLRDYSTGSPSVLEPFLINPLVSCACSLVRYRKGAPSNLVIEQCTKATADVEIIGNEGQVFEVVMNLMVNALEAVAGAAAPQIVVETDRVGGTVSIRVRDNGVGVPVSVEGNLFEPYTTSKGTGRGIGLSVSRAIAQAHRGDLSLIDSGGGGRGALFELSLPVGSLSTKHEPDVDLGRARRVVLVSEDEADVRRLIAHDAEHLGLTVMNAGDTADLLALASKMKEVLAAAIIDSCEVDSEQGAVACLRRISPELPIILISGKLTSKGRRPTPWGKVENLPKPFDSALLIRTLEATVLPPTRTGD